MAKVKVFNMQAQEVGTMTLADELFAVEYNEPLIHQAVVAYNANQRQGTKSVLTRSEVRGKAAKPWRQKGTGRARHGSRKAPQWTGGGVAFAPKPRDFYKRMNRQAKRHAVLSALSEKIRQNQVIVLDKFDCANAKTKEAQAFLDAFKFGGSTLVVNDKNLANVKRACANIPTLNLQEASDLTTYEVVASKNVVLTQAAIKSIEEAYAE